MFITKRLAQRKCDLHLPQNRYKITAKYPNNVVLKSFNQQPADIKNVPTLVEDVFYYINYKLSKS